MNFCGHCGAAAGASNCLCEPCAGSLRTAPSDNPDLHALHGDWQLCLFVGPGYAFYRRAWTAMGARRAVWSWNWAAFFLGPVWLAYRKMRRAWLVLSALLLANAWFDLSAGISKTGCWLLCAGVFTLFGGLGNYLYHRHARARIAAITARHPPAEAERLLRSRGGISVLETLGFVFALLLASVVLFVLGHVQRS